MNFWIFEAIAGYFLTGTTRVIDKILLSRAIPDPLVFTFYVGVLSAFSLFLIPFGVQAIPAMLFPVAIAAGVSFLIGLYFFYCALAKHEISRVVPLVISMGPFMTLLFSLFFLGEHIDSRGVAGIVFLIIGGVLLSWEKKDRHTLQATLLVYTFFAALFTSIGFVLADEIFHKTSFISGFVWTRLGIVLAAVILILLPSARAHIFTARVPRPKHILLFIGNKWVGGSAYFFITHAISRASQGSVSFVYALGSFEYLSVFLFSIILTRLAPGVLRENFSRHALGVKLLGTGFLTAALYILLNAVALRP